MPKHKVIAQTWAKRKDFEDKGRLSITLYNTHTDPVGLNFDVNDLNSSETNEISSTWVHYLPQCVKRRMALTGVTPGNTNSSSQGQAGRKNSLDSEISVSVRHVSVESRRNSVDSQVSVKIAEMKTKVASRSRQHGKHAYSSSSNKRSQRRRDFIAASSGRTKYSSGGRGRRESSTSVESQVIALKKTTYPNASHKVGMFAQSTKKHNSTRRRNGGLDPTIINDFIQKNGQFILPFLQNQGMTTSSDEEDNSRASFKIHDLNVVVKQELSDDDDLKMNDDGPQIQELPSNGSKSAALEHFLKHMQKSSESNCNGNRHSRNSQRSRRSRKEQAKSQRHGDFKLDHDLDVDSTSDFKQQYVRQLTAAIDVNGDSISGSSVEMDVPLDILLHSSYSGMSTGKPNSRNSKTSCDVGIQANPFDIATHTLPTYGSEELQQAMRLLNAASRQRNEMMSEDATEMQSLLGPRHHREPTLMSESDKLKMLLLPSK